MLLASPGLDGGAAGSLLKVLEDAALHAKRLRAWYLQNQIPCPVYVLEDKLVLKLRIWLHLNFILLGKRLWGRRLNGLRFSFWDISRIGLELLNCYVRRRTRTGSRGAQVGVGGLHFASGTETLYGADAHGELPRRDSAKEAVLSAPFAYALIATA